MASSSRRPLPRARWHHQAARAGRRQVGPPRRGPTVRLVHRHSSADQRTGFHRRSVPRGHQVGPARAAPSPAVWSLPRRRSPSPVPRRRHRSSGRSPYRRTTRSPRVRRPEGPFHVEQRRSRQNSIEALSPPRRLQSCRRPRPDDVPLHGPHRPDPRSPPEQRSRRAGVGLRSEYQPLQARRMFHVKPTQATPTTDRSEGEPGATPSPSRSRCSTACCDSSPSTPRHFENRIRGSSQSLGRRAGCSTLSHDIAHRDHSEGQPGGRSRPVRHKHRRRNTRPGSCPHRRDEAAIDDRGPNTDLPTDRSGPCVPTTEVQTCGRPQTLNVRPLRSIAKTHSGSLKPAEAAGEPRPSRHSRSTPRAVDRSTDHCATCQSGRRQTSCHPLATSSIEMLQPSKSHQGWGSCAGPDSAAAVGENNRRVGVGGSIPAGAGPPSSGRSEHRWPRSAPRLGAPSS